MRRKKDKPDRPQIFGDNSRTRYGSDGMSSTPAFGNNYREYYYHKVAIKQRIETGASYEVGFWPFTQIRTIVHRYTEYYRLTFAKDGTLVDTQYLYTFQEQDFSAVGSITGNTHKEAFQNPEGFGEFATNFVEEIAKLSISIGYGISFGGSSSSDKPDWGELDYFIHYNEEKATQAKERVDSEIAIREQIDVASDVRFALSKLNQNQITSEQASQLLEQIGIPNQRVDDKVTIVSSEDDGYVLEACAQVGGSDLLVIGADNTSKIIDVYNQIDKEGTQLTLISTSNRDYSVQVGKSYTAEYLMNFATDATNIPPGYYQVVDVDITDISSVDEYGNIYTDPECIYASVPVAELIIRIKSE